MVGQLRQITTDYDPLPLTKSALHVQFQLLFDVVAKLHDIVKKAEPLVKSRATRNALVTGRIIMMDSGVAAAFELFSELG